MDSETKIRILEFWIEHWNSWSEDGLFSTISDDLKGKVSQEELVSLFNEIEHSYNPQGINNISPADLYRHVETLRKKILEELQIESIKSQKIINQRQVEILEKQTELLEKQSNFSQKQNSLLKSTFLIYTLIALTMISELITNYYYNIEKISFGRALIVGFIILAFTIIFVEILNYIGEELNIPLGKWKKRAIVGIVLLIIFIGFLMIYTPTKNLFGTTPETRIIIKEGNININSSKFISFDIQVNNSIQNLNNKNLTKTIFQNLSK